MAPCMNTDINGRPKTLSEAKAWMHQRLASRTHPMNALPLQDGPAWIDGVPALDGESWGRYWGELGDMVAAQAAAAESAGDGPRAAKLYQKASGLYFMGRFPCPNHPAKQRCAEAERQAPHDTGRNRSSARSCRSPGAKAKGRTSCCSSDGQRRAAGRRWC